ncbi:MAG: hypothetical protein ACP8RL_04415 [cyanobacterium endosymbiont of Rhopalodia inflata]
MTPAEVILPTPGECNIDVLYLQELPVLYQPLKELPACLIS